MPPSPSALPARGDGPTSGVADSGAGGRASAGFVQGLVVGGRLGGILTGGLAIWALRPQPAPIVAQPPPPTATLAAPTPAPMTVYVSGAVLAPGLYTLAGEARVADALAAAGGLSADADGDRLNLAQRLADGSRLHVPKAGEAPLAAPESLPVVSAEPGAAPQRSVPLRLSGAPVNLNSATLDELLALPGVGEKTAAAIMEARPFPSVEALDDVPGIGPAMMEKLRPLVAAP